tara:strand:- start:462 stop:575 length:114 start_codon:yes stop_codon:yes gene_type:complete
MNDDQGFLSIIFGALILGGVKIIFVVMIILFVLLHAL